ncbi:MAG: cytochrome c, partial [Henriciella sp.]|uniref:c-type cytochrome n=1 Tax=Henriciella sp. TaxID=1968823 RepID=UPI003C70D181
MASTCDRYLSTFTASIAILVLLGPASAQEGGGESDVERGEYLSHAAGCTACHTDPDEGERFAGGRMLPTPFGVVSVPNITPHEETGIGSWDAANFKRALHEGIRKDGAPIYPAMPYTNFTMIRDEDVEALWAYFQSVEPVENEVDDNTLPFPFNVRTGISGWQAVYFEPGRFEPDPDESEEFNRGAYLAEALTHCSACHTPRNSVGAKLGNAQHLKGAPLKPWYAPNISGDENSVLDSYTIESLTAFLSEGHDGEGRTPYGRMAETVYESTAMLN